MKTKARVALAAVAAALAAGCAAPNTAGTTVGLASEGEGGLQQILQTDNARLAKQLEVVDRTVGQTKNGLMKASVKVVSRLNKDIGVQSKFVWFDAEGAEIDPDTAPWCCTARRRGLSRAWRPTPAPPLSNCASARAKRQSGSSSRRQAQKQ